MHLSTAVLLGLLGAAQAHTTPKNVYRNGQSPGLGVCLRQPRESWNNSPVRPSSNDVVCGIDGTKGATRTCPFKGGDTLTIDYVHAQTPEHGGQYLHDSHAGPCSVMMKKVESATKDPAVGDGWFRIAYEDYNNQTGKWCTNRVSTEGAISVVLPTDLPGGDYLVRVELLALHAAPKGDPQFYVTCAQIFLDSPGSTLPGDTVAIPSKEYAQESDPAMSWNLWEYGRDHSTYPGYGPPTYVSGPVDPNAKFTGTQTDGLRPSNCIMESRNWCATPEPKYTNEDQCWKANENCWTQHKGCYEAIPLEYKACDLWSERCKARANTCRSGSPSGPDTKDNTPAPPTISPPAPFGQSGSGNVRPQAVSKSSSSSDAAYAQASTSASSDTSVTTTSAPTQTADSQGSSPSSSDASASTEVADSQVTLTSSSTSESDSGSAAQPTVASETAASAEADDICPSAITETVTEVITVTATTSTVVDATATGNSKAYEYRRVRRAM